MWYEMSWRIHNHLPPCSILEISQVWNEEVTLKCIIPTVRPTTECQGSENGSDATDKQTVHWEISWEFIRRQNVVFFMVSDKGRKVSQKEPATRLSLISSKLNKGREFQLKNIPVGMWGNCGKRPQLIRCTHYMNGGPSHYQ